MEKNMTNFQWQDPFLLDEQLSIEEKMIRDTAQKYSQDKLQTRVKEAWREEIIDKDYPPSEFNIYPFHFSDGDNWSADDTRLCVDLLKNKLSSIFFMQSKCPFGHFSNPILLQGLQERFFTSIILDSESDR